MSTIPVDVSGKISRQASRTADATEVIAFFVKEQTFEQGAGVRGGRGIARTQAAIDVLERLFFVLGRILLEALDHVAFIHRSVHDLDFRHAEFGDLLDDLTSLLAAVGPCRGERSPRPPGVQRAKRCGSGTWKAAKRSALLILEKRDFQETPIPGHDLFLFLGTDF